MSDDYGWDDGGSDSGYGSGGPSGPSGYEDSGSSGSSGGYEDSSGYEDASGYGSSGGSVTIAASHETERPVYDGSSSAAASPEALAAGGEPDPEDGWSTLRVAAAAGGGLLVSAFLGAVGAQLGERSVQGARDRFARRRNGAGTREGDSATQSAFLDAVRVVCDARPSDGVAVRLSGPNRTVTVVHASLPPDAVAQFRRLDLADPQIADLVVTWEGRVSGYNVHDVWVDSSDVWATSFKPARARGDVRDRAIRYVWNDRILLWQRRTDEPWRSGDDAGGP
ncbi:hypothetical protein [Streptomyces sp. NBC_01508]|uniref:hypothetical protein n=1 Tax=Streptomyces sp. NBC_01508 TaxID=2903888 RepID=UPI0038701A1A